ncbi:MAG: hypothetical protein AAGA80_27625 [Cyanobacteria bacterium P01_F01_bin.143]
MVNPPAKVLCTAGRWVWKLNRLLSRKIRIFDYMKDSIKEALRAEKAMNQALKDQQAKSKKPRSTSKVTVVAKKNLI